MTKSEQKLLLKIIIPLVVAGISALISFLGLSAHMIVNQPSQASVNRVISVVDGDTIKVDYQGETETIRLIGVDTPETKHPSKPVECFGKEAAAKTKELVTGKSVYLEFDSSQGERDKYGRLLAYVWLSLPTTNPTPELLNYALVADGYAHEYTYRYPYKYQSEFKAASRIAQQSELGLFGDICTAN